MTKFCIQDNYPQQYCHCYGCGKENPEGLRIKSWWDGQQALARFTPRDEHIALPGYVYGGLIASIIDCHGIATASARAAAEKDSEKHRLKRYVTAALNVDFLKPTPLGIELEIRGMAQEFHRRKVKVKVEIFVENIITAQGVVIAVPMPDSMKR
ncbi:PaaI family thioesterase [Desulfonatronovibrio magnus]|uniref:PaaI family thioesterase n=1 Tax=Desulfonatronovibrio magnus TaxID=698827 RepID=UPI0005EB600B|nr:PaaI family thioesterase [Desulfonatronovibrio magnus]